MHISSFILILLSSVSLLTLGVIAVGFRCRPLVTAAGKVNPNINPNPSLICVQNCKMEANGKWLAVKKQSEMYCYSCSYNKMYSFFHWTDCKLQLINTS